jgi:hypothetical protein
MRAQACSIGNMVITYNHIEKTSILKDKTLLKLNNIFILGRILKVP